MGGVLTAPSLFSPLPSETLPYESIPSHFTFLFSQRKLTLEGKGQPALSQERVDILLPVCVLISQGREAGIARKSSLDLGKGMFFFFCGLKIETESKGSQWFLILTQVLCSLLAYSQFCNNLVRGSATCVTLTYGRLSHAVFLQPGKL